MAGTPVHGPVVASNILLVGQAPGPHEAAKGRPFAHTAGQRLFRWFEDATGVDEAAFRSGVYMTAVARCYPGKAASGDRVPDGEEIVRCSRFLKREVALIEPQLVIAVGNVAIRQVLGSERYGNGARLAEVVGTMLEADFLEASVDVICLPHPSGLSAWPKTEPGKSLLAEALRLIAGHPEWIRTFA